MRGRALVGLVLWPLTTVLAFGAGYLGLSAVVTTVRLDGPGRPVDALTAPRTPTVADRAALRVDRLIERHGCWSGEAPADLAGGLPLHAVVTLPGRRPAFVDSGVGFDLWTGVRAGRLHAFCR
ncbi:hypothetical protein [Nocardioides mesophilus]|uniref:Uncharacterized protein n=1 Tax=Nocardioides mesophilus TaxID=433659 RepID=A0A7G9R9M5_9ACTN|nr:hypothetical protein [Nocardioides mesophilus]QNN52300.1 hypothetical protein H9L09_17710 [Nocardioides mesophilus]